MLRFLVAVALAMAVTTCIRGSAATPPRSASVSSARAQGTAEPLDADPVGEQSPRALEHGLGGDRAPTGAAGRRASGGTPRVDFEGDRLGLELQRNLPGGVKARWERDALGRPQLQEVQVHGVVQSARQYHWESNDRLRAIIDSLKGPVHYTHDALGNLAAATYQDGRVDLRLPDALGNLFRTADQNDRKYGPAGQLLEATDARGTTHYSYDAEGNLIRKVEPDGKEWRYRWNLTGMLVGVKRPDGERVEFGYDPLARRVFKTYRGKTTHWIWDGNVPLHEWVELSDEALARDGAPLATSFEREIAAAKRKAVLSRRSAQGPPSSAGYGAAFGDASSPREAEPEIPLLEGTPDSPITWLFEPESFAPLAKLVSDERYSIVTDHLGTPRAMFDAHGEEVWGAEVDTYGQLNDVRWPRRACPFRFPGQYEDAETGLFYNRFRYYDSESGGYVSQDPIGLQGGLKTHAYARDPLVWIDPLGMSCGKSDGAPAAIETPYGPALQSSTEAARNAQMAVSRGVPLFRGGTLGRSQGPEAQFWSLENPMSPGYAEKFGIPAENMKFDFVEVGTLKPGQPYITREAPGIGANAGGAIEVVTNPGAVMLDYFHMP